MDGWVGGVRWGEIPIGELFKSSWEISIGGVNWNNRRGIETLEGLNITRIQRGEYIVCSRGVLLRWQKGSSVTCACNQICRRVSWTAEPMPPHGTVSILPWQQRRKPVSLRIKFRLPRTILREFRTSSRCALRIRFGFTVVYLHGGSEVMLFLVSVHSSTIRLSQDSHVKLHAEEWGWRMTEVSATSERDFWEWERS